MCETKKQLATKILNNCNEILEYHQYHPQPQEVLEGILERGKILLKLSETNIEAYKIMAQAQEGLGNPMEALVSCNQWIFHLQGKNLEEELQESYTLKATILANSGHEKEAIDIYNAIIESKTFKNNPTLDVYMLRAYTSTCLGDFPTAIKDFTSILEITPNDYNVVLQRARTHMGLGFTDFAIEDYKTLHAQYPDNIEYMEAILNCALDLDLEDQISHYKTKVEAILPGYSRELSRKPEEYH